MDKSTEQVEREYENVFGKSVGDTDPANKKLQLANSTVHSMVSLYKEKDTVYSHCPTYIDTKRRLKEIYTMTKILSEEWDRLYTARENTNDPTTRKQLECRIAFVFASLKQNSMTLDQLTLQKRQLKTLMVRYELSKVAGMFDVCMPDHTVFLTPTVGGSE